jgi:hypothetical protein
VYNRFRVTPAEFEKQGYLVVEEHLPAAECEKLLAAVTGYRNSHKVPVIERPSGDRPLRYSVIDGVRICEHLPQIAPLAEKVNDLVNSLSGRTLAPLGDERVAVNINITSKGGAYRWHYDRNAVTAILYLNSVKGGETECYPNYRVSVPGGRSSTLQRAADRLVQTQLLRRTFGRRVLVSPKSGTLLVMLGRQCLHSVLPVTGDTDRVNVIFSFDLPGKTFAVADRLNNYLYDGTSAAAGDPNYT